MAETWATLKSVRMKLRDPAGVINLEHVANAAALPTVPVSQTAYRKDDTGVYAVLVGTVWTDKQLKISDNVLNDLIESHGENEAIVKAIPQIVAAIADEMRMIQFSAGVETYQYQSLSDMIKFYEKLSAVYQKEADETTGISTGRIFKTCHKPIGGVAEW